MAVEMKCICEEQHLGHVCVLRSLGLTDEVACLSINPTYACFTCGAEVNNPKNVCQPVPLES